jgi:hypothetical protein
MTRSLYVEPEAEDELAEAVAWYDQRGEGIGDRLLADVQATLGRVVERPGACALVADVDPDLGVRRALCRRFPYAVTFLEVGETLHVIAFAHLSRRPGYWEDRLP